MQSSLAMGVSVRVLKYPPAHYKIERSADALVISAISTSAASSFETAVLRPPQDEVLDLHGEDEVLDPHGKERVFPAAACAPRIKSGAGFARNALAR